MKCPICKERDLEILKETNQFNSTLTTFGECQGCKKTFLRRTDFHISGIISQDVLYMKKDKELGNWSFYKDLYRKG